MHRGVAVATEAGAGAGAGLGLPGLGVLLVAMEAGVPIPIPSDLVVLVLGERTAAGTFPLWAAVLLLEVVAVVGTGALLLACRGPGRAVIGRLGPRLGLTAERLAKATALVERKGRGALAVGRATPGLRTLTVLATGSSGISVARALPALVVGSSVFLQLHLVLGYLLGPVARNGSSRPKGRRWRCWPSWPSPASPCGSASGADGRAPRPRPRPAAPPASPSASWSPAPPAWRHSHDATW